VTDANVALGILSREALLGGRMPISAAAADRAIDALGERLGLDRAPVAEGVLAIVTANMARAIRVVSIERGYDPRDFTLVAFGGAGPLHAARLARELEIPRVLVPAAPGILFALGLLVADLRMDFSKSRRLPATAAALPELERELQLLVRDAQRWLDAEGVEPRQRRLRRLADMRYAGQNYELNIELPRRMTSGEHLALTLDRFHAAHEQAYGFDAADEPVQLVTLRVEASGAVPAVQPAVGEERRADARSGTHRRVYLSEAGGWCDCPVYERGELGGGAAFEGPAIVEQMDATTLVLPGQRATVDRHGQLLIEEKGAGE
jgi:N-methylhydantoinase A